LRVVALCKSQNLSKHPEQILQLSLLLTKFRPFCWEHVFAGKQRNRDWDTQKSKIIKSKRGQELKTKRFDGKKEVMRLGNGKKHSFAL
jgi:hypothetical protein